MPYQQTFSRIAEFLSSTSLCSLIGYEVDAQARNKLLKPVIDRAKGAGFTDDAVTAMFQDAATRQEFGQLLVAHAFKADLDEANGDPNVLTRELDGAFRKHDGDCRRFAASDEFGSLITAPADPDNTAGLQSFTSTMLAAHRVGKAAQTQ